METKKYYRCWKCAGCVSETYGIMCTQPMAVRTSGICGGSTTEEISKEAYDEMILKWDSVGVTEDKKAPVDDKETAESVLLRRGVQYTIPQDIRTVTVKSALQAMQEYASQERNRAISECIEIVKKEQLDTDDHYGYVACANILEKIKK